MHTFFAVRIPYRLCSFHSHLILLCIFYGLLFPASLAVNNVSVRTSAQIRMAGNESNQILTRTDHHCLRVVRKYNSRFKNPVIQLFLSIVDHDFRTIFQKLDIPEIRCTAPASVAGNHTVAALAADRHTRSAQDCRPFVQMFVSRSDIQRQFYLHIRNADEADCTILPCRILLIIFWSGNLLSFFCKFAVISLHLQIQIIFFA